MAYKHHHLTIQEVAKDAKTRGWNLLRKEIYSISSFLSASPVNCIHYKGDKTSYSGHCLTQVTKGHMTSIGTTHSHVLPDKEAVHRTHHLSWEILTKNAWPKFNFEDISVRFKTTVLNFKRDKSQLSREGQQGREFCLAVNNLNPKRLPCPKPLGSVRCL